MCVSSVECWALAEVCTLLSAILVHYVLLLENCIIECVHYFVPHAILCFHLLWEIKLWNTSPACQWHFGTRPQSAWIRSPKLMNPNYSVFNNIFNIFLMPPTTAADSTFAWTHTHSFSAESESVFDYFGTWPLSILIRCHGADISRHLTN